MIDNTVGELAAVIGARVEIDGREPAAALLDAAVTDLVYDSRDAHPGSLFVALPGERVDGHDYASVAWQAGAVAAITSRPVPGGLCLITEDPVAAMGAISRQVIARAKAGGLQVIGITGSAGKSTTKDLLAQILERVAPVVAPRGSMNNEIGLPTTASWVRAETRFLIAEMGAKGIGHIRYLCGITPPDIGVVLNVGAAHLGKFGSQDAIAQAKGELAEAASAAVVLNLDDPRVRAMSSRASVPATFFGVQSPEPVEGRFDKLSTPVDKLSTPDVEATGLQADDLDRWSFTLRIAGEQHPVRLRLLGRHQVANAVAAAAAAHVAGVPAAVIAEALSAADSRSHWRMELHDLPGGGLLINDAYNANPASMAAALDTLSSIRDRRRTADPATTTTAVLGEMLELGADSDSLHRQLGRTVVEHRIDRLITVGAGAEPIRAGALAAGMDAAAVTQVPGKDDALDLLQDLCAADLVLIKASRDVGLESIGEQLLAGGPQHARTDARN